MSALLAVAAVAAILAGLLFGLLRQESWRRRRAEAALQRTRNNALALQKFAAQAAEITAGQAAEVKRIEEAKDEDEVAQAVDAVIARWNAGD